MPYYNMNDMGVKSEAVSPLAEIQSIVGELMKFGLVTYYKGEGSKPHFHPNDEQFVFILEGQRMSILGDDERVVGPGDILHIPRDTRHGATTLSEKCVSIIIKSPAGSGVLGEDYNEAKDADDVIRRLSENLGEDVKY